MLVLAVNKIEPVVSVSTTLAAVKLPVTDVPLELVTVKVFNGVVWPTEPRRVMIPVASRVRFWAPLTFLSLMRPFEELIEEAAFIETASVRFMKTLSN